MRTEIFKDYDAFLARPDKAVNGVTQAFADAHPGWGEDCSNRACWNCSDCSDCSGCSRCSDCSGRKGASSTAPPVPVIENIHQSVLEAASKPDAFDMGSWHACETTHCRAGWVVRLAGEAGAALEAFHDTPLAALLIYRASGGPKVTFPRFYETNEVAMADMRRCADEERAMLAAREGGGE